MARLVSPEPAGAPRGGTAPAQSAAAKGWLERVAKYVPSEVVATYLALLGFLPGVPENIQSGMAIGAFVVCWILTPVYLNAMAHTDQPKMKHIGVSSMAFPIWAYAVGGQNGVFGPEVLNWYNVAVASMILVVFSAISGLVVPKAGEK